jgi:hypothetical protein
MGKRIEKPQSDKAPSFEDLEGLEVAGPSFEELAALDAAEEPKGMGAAALELLAKSQAATRAGMLPVAAKGLSGLPEALPAALSQFEAPPEEAPTMREVMQVAGVPETEIPIPSGEIGIAGPSPEEMQAFASKYLGGAEVPTKAPASELAAIGGEMAFDPLNIGVPAAGKALEVGLPLTGKAIAGTAGLARDVTKKGTQLAAAGTAGTIGAFAGKGAEYAGKTYAGVGRIFEALENIPESVRQAYNDLKPTIKPKFIEQYALANEVGIDPDLLAENARLMYGPDAFVTQAKASQRSITPAIEGEKFDKLQAQIASAAERQAEAASKGLLSASDPVSVGNSIKKSFDEKVSNLFDSTTVRYSQLPDVIPSKSLDVESSSSLYNILGERLRLEEKKLRLATTDAAKKPHRANIQAIETVRNNIFERVPKKESFVDQLFRRIQGKPAPTENVFVGDLEQAVEQLQQVGREGYSSQSFIGTGDVPASKSLLKDLYKDIRSVIIETVQKERPDLVKGLIESNKKQAEFFDKVKPIAKIVQDDKIAPEQVYQRLVSSSNSLNLDALKFITKDTEAFDMIRGQMLFDQIKKSGQDVPLYNSILKGMRTTDNKRIFNTFKYGDQTDDPIRLFEEVIRLGQDIGAKEFNPSRSGVLLKTLEYIQRPIRAIEGAVTGRATVDLLEAEAYAKYFADLDIDQTLNMRIRGGFNDRLLDEVLANKMKDPVMAAKFQERIKRGLITPEILDAFQARAAKQNPISRFANTKKAIGLYYNTMGHAENKLGITSRALSVANRVAKKESDEGQSIPLFIPEEDRADVADAVKESKMSAVQKAKNLRNLAISGYLLDLTGFDGPEKMPGVVQKILKKDAFKPEKQEELKQDKPDVLKSLKDRGE